jgi:hypothetical protein
MEFLNKLWEAYAKAIGLDEKSTAQVTLLILLVGLLSTGSWKLFKLYITRKNRAVLNRDLHPYFSNKQVASATKNYIPCKYQEAKPGQRKKGKPQSLIKYFLKKVFTADSESETFFLILGDTGRGKTVFMINLYMAYKNKRNFFQSHPSYAIRLFPLGSPTALDNIRKIKDPENTILLLDSFDEDTLAVKDYVNRLQEIAKTTWMFRRVVITCRNQFFSTVEEEPDEISTLTGDFFLNNKFKKIHLSDFTEKDVLKYLRRKFSFWQVTSFNRAKQIYYSCPALFKRPMLLNYIDDVQDAFARLRYPYTTHTSKAYFSTIYECLINKWIEREAENPIIKAEYGNKASPYKQWLYEFSEGLAVNMYEHGTERGGYFIKKDDPFFLNFQGADPRITLDQLSFDNDNKLTRSLLDKREGGSYVFYHKSIMEYFLSKKMIRDKRFFLSFNFKGMEAAKDFFAEMLIDELSKYKGDVYFEYAARNTSLGFLKVSHYKIATLFDLKYDKAMEISYLRFFPKLKIIIFDPCNDYLIGSFYALSALKSLVQKNNWELCWDIKEKYEPLTFIDTALNNFAAVIERLKLNGIRKRLDVMQEGIISAWRTSKVRVIMSRSNYSTKECDDISFKIERDGQLEYLSIPGEYWWDKENDPALHLWNEFLYIMNRNKQLFFTKQTKEEVNLNMRTTWFSYHKHLEEEAINKLNRLNYVIEKVAPYEPLFSPQTHLFY